MVGLSRLAVKTVPAGDERFNGDPVAPFHMGHLGTHLTDHAGKFMTWNQGINGPFKFTIEEMAIRAADTTGFHINGNLSFAGIGIGTLLDLEGTRFFNDDCLHLFYLLCP